MPIQVAVGTYCNRVHHRQGSTKQREDLKPGTSKIFIILLYIGRWIVRLAVTDQPLAQSLRRPGCGDGRRVWAGTDGRRRPCSAFTTTTRPRSSPRSTCATSFVEADLEQQRPDQQGHRERDLQRDERLEQARRVWSSAGLFPAPALASTSTAGPARCRRAARSRRDILPRSGSSSLGRHRRDCRGGRGQERLADDGANR